MNPRRSSSVTVLSRDSQKPGMSKRKRLIIIGAVVVLAAVGVAVGVVVSKDSSDSSSTASGDNSSKSSGSSTSGTSTNGGTSTSTDSTSSGTSGSSNSTSTTATITSDPTKATLSLAAFAIGDWGSTVEKDSCCSDDSSYTDYDVIAEDVVAKLMNIQAGASGAVKPKVIMGHGDNFYWSGINGDSDATYRFTNTFEKKFSGANLADIPWVNVMGNHDYGGSSFVCTKDGEMAECADQAALVAAIDSKFSWQAKYVSPNGNRWIMEDHFYVHSIKDDASGVSIDIFNMDTNDADSHGAQQICCQCYGYAAGDDSKCKNVVRGDAYCAGGSTDMYDACMKQLSAWGDDSRKQLAEKVKASKATWKIVNSHYSPYNHYAADRQDMWKELLDGLGVQIWMNGHTHGEKHDHASFGVHFIENGAGGGILNEAASGIPPYVTYLEKVWTYANHDYGFFELSASEEWMKVRFLTFDDKWNIADDFKASTLGGVADHHCWYIPVDGSLGKSCDKTK